MSQVPKHDARPALADIVGAATIGPELCLTAPLDECIFSVTAAALSDAAMSLAEIDAVYVATSDVFDGRAISTMTLTASTGSFGKHEMKVCDDGLGALALAADGLRAGSAGTALVTSWSRLSEGDLNVMDPWAVEPAFHRPLGFRGATVASLQRSRWKGQTTFVTEPTPRGGDAAVSLVIAPPTERPDRRGRLLGAGWSAGPYLLPSDSPLTPLREAVDRALVDAGIARHDVDALQCGGFFDITDSELQNAAAVLRPVRRTDLNTLELGYATGLLALVDALRHPGLTLVISRAGIGTSRAYATIVEGAP